MEKSGASELDNIIKPENITTQQDIQTTECETLKVRLNKDHVLVVNKQKLLEKPHYFTMITKSYFADHTFEVTEVSISSKLRIFQKGNYYVIN